MHLYAWRIIFLLPFLSLSGCSHVTSSGSDPEKDSLTGTIDEKVQELEAEVGGRIGVSVRSLEKDFQFEHRGDELFHAASTMKVPVMIEVFRQTEEGRFSLDDTIVVNPECRSLLDDSPFICDAGDYIDSRIGEPETIRRLVEEMIRVSDNLATNLLIEKCSAKQITAAMREMGAQRGFVIRGVQDIPAYQAGISNRMCPNDLTTLMAAIALGSAGNKESCREMTEILLGQKYRDMIPAELPEGTRVAHKTGSITGVRHDTAIVYAPFGTYCITILADQLKEGDLGKSANAELSRFVYDYLEKLP